MLACRAYAFVVWWSVLPSSSVLLPHGLVCPTLVACAKRRGAYPFTQWQVAFPCAYSLIVCTIRLGLIPHHSYRWARPNMALEYDACIRGEK